MVSGVADLWGRIKAALCSPVISLLMAAALMAMLLTGETVGRDDAKLEKRIADALSRVPGAGQVEVIIRTREENTGKTPCGAVAVAMNANDPLVRLELTQALCALLGLQAADVSVISSWGGEG